MANEFARQLRQNMTPQEVRLWVRLRALKRERGWKFRRQVPLRGYIVDFACFEARLVVEVDGSQHANSASDKERDAMLARGGFTVLRFWNREIDHEFDGVCLTIERHLLLALDGRSGREADGVGGGADA